MVKTSERLIELCTNLDIRQSDLCRATEIEKSSMSNYCSGKREPKKEVLLKIAEAYHVNPLWLMGYDVHFREKEPSEKIEIDLGVVKVFNNLSEENKNLIISLIYKLQ